MIRRAHRGIVAVLGAVGLIVSSTSALILVPVGSASASTDFTSFSPPITGATDFATDFPNSGLPFGIGPIGMLDDGTNFFVSDYDNGLLYKFPITGGDAATVPSASDFLFGLALSNGTYFATNLGPTVDTFDPSTLAVSTTNVVLPCGGLGIAADPLSTDLYVDTYCGIYRVQNPTSASPTVTLFSTTLGGDEFDGISISADGQVFWAADTTAAEAVEFNRSGTVIDTVSDPDGVDGIGIAQPGVISNGINVSNNVFINNNNGTIWRVDTNNSDAVSTVASGGTRGDFVITGPDGCLYAVQTDRIEKLAPCFFQPTGKTGAAPNVSDVLQVETSASYAGATVLLSSSQLQGSCASLTFETLQGGSPSAPTVMANSIPVVLDDDGNVTVVVNGVDCAPGSDVVDASMTEAPFLTALTTLVIDPPQVTPTGVTGYPTNEVETGNSPASGDSDVYTVFYVETSSVYAEQPVEISSPELVDRCLEGSRWESNGSGSPFVDSPTATATLDDDGNAEFVFKGASCAAGASAVIADVEAGNHPTYTTTYSIVAPMVTLASTMKIAAASKHRRHHHGSGGSGSGTGGAPQPMTLTASPNPLIEAGG